MRCHQLHSIYIYNYLNLSLAASLKQQLFSRPVQADRSSDQRALRQIVWPVARWDCLRVATKVFTIREEAHTRHYYYAMLTGH